MAFIRCPLPAPAETPRSGNRSGRSRCAPREELRRALRDHASREVEVVPGQTPRRRLLAWAGAGAALLAVAFTAHLAWSIYLAPFDAAADVVGRLATVAAPAQPSGARSGAQAAFEKAQADLQRAQRAHVRQDGLSAAANASLASGRADVAKSFSELESVRRR